MVKLSLGKVLDCFGLSSNSRSGLCMSFVESYDGDDDEFEKKALVGCDGSKLLMMKDVVAGKQTLALQLKPKMVMLRVSMHCNGCAKKVGKHISKIQGVISYKVDLESKMVVVIGDILPFEVLESVSRVKNAEIWSSPEKKEKDS